MGLLLWIPEPPRCGFRRAVQFHRFPYVDLAGPGLVFQPHVPRLLRHSHCLPRPICLVLCTSPLKPLAVHLRVTLVFIISIDLYILSETPGSSAMLKCTGRLLPIRRRRIAALQIGFRHLRPSLGSIHVCFSSLPAYFAPLHIYTSSHHVCFLIWILCGSSSPVGYLCHIRYSTFASIKTRF